MVILNLFFGVQVCAEQNSDNQGDFFQMSLEELSEVNIVSASRQPHHESEVSAPVSVITAEDIHYSGLTSIPEILNFTPGVDVIKISRGPSGGAWGANAFNGAINIITKKPEYVLGTFGSATVSEFKDTYTHLRYAEKQDKRTWRIPFTDNPPCYKCR